jgi:hypothetical protein
MWRDGNFGNFFIYWGFVFSNWLLMQYFFIYMLCFLVRKNQWYVLSLWVQMTDNTNHTRRRCYGASGQLGMTWDLGNEKWMAARAGLFRQINDAFARCCLSPKIMKLVRGRQGGLVQVGVSIEHGQFITRCIRV